MSSTGRGLALGMAGSRGSDSVRSSSHFSPLLLFLVVVFTDLPRSGSPHLTSHQLSSLRRKRALPCKCPRNVSGLNLIAPPTCQAQGRDRIGWPNLKHVPTPERASGRCFPKGDGHGCLEEEEVLGGHNSCCVPPGPPLLDTPCMSRSCFS